MRRRPTRGRVLAVDVGTPNTKMALIMNADGVRTVDLDAAVEARQRRVNLDRVRREVHKP